MKEIITKYPDIQEKILDVLPSDGLIALGVMSQLTANMILSIKDANIDSFINNLKSDLALYEGT